MTLRVLVVDDEKRWQGHIEKLVRFNGHEPTIVSSGHEAEKLLLSDKFDAVITDMRMPNGNGVELCQWVNRALEIKPIIYVHSSDDEFYFEGNRLNLPRHISKYFGEFAEFHLKNTSWFDQVDEFLKRIDAAE